MKTARTLSHAPRLGRTLLLSTLLCSFALTPTLAQAQESKYSHFSTEELEEERSDTGVAGPIVLLSLGGFTFLLGTPILLAGIFGSSTCDYSFDCSASNAVTVVGAVMTTAGAGMGIGGGVWLGSRVRERRAMDRELKRRKAAEVSFDAGFSPTLQYGFVPTPGGAGFGFSGTF